MATKDKKEKGEQDTESVEKPAEPTEPVTKDEEPTPVEAAGGGDAEPSKGKNDKSADEGGDENEDKGKTSKKVKKDDHKDDAAQSAWSSAIEVSRGASYRGVSTALGGAVVVDRTATFITAVFPVGGGGYQEVFANESVDGATFTVPLKVGPDGSVTGTTPLRLAIGARDEKVVAWQDYLTGSRFGYVSRKPAQGRWGAPLQVTDFVTIGSDVAIANNGDIYYAYAHEYVPRSDSAIEVKVSRDGGRSFNLLSVLPDRGKWTNVVRIAINDGGVICLVYERGTFNNYHIVAQTFSGGSWSVPTVLWGGRGFWPDLKSIGNHFIACWQTNDGTKDIWAAKYENGQWSLPVNVSNTNGQSLNPSIAADELYRLTVGWTEVQSGTKPVKLPKGTDEIITASDVPTGTPTPLFVATEQPDGSFITETVGSSRTEGSALYYGGQKLTLTFQQDTAGTGAWKNIYRSKLVVLPTPFTDLAGNPFSADIISLYYMGGCGPADPAQPNLYQPHADATRAQFAQAIVEGYRIPIVNPSRQTFSDVPPNHPFYSYIETAHSAGIIQGFSDGTYGPELPLTRGQMAKLVVTAAQYGLVDPPTATFPDVPVGSFFYEYVETAHANGVVNGFPDGNYQIDWHVSRDQMPAFIMRALRHPAGS